ncbi:hypothetical protein niasHT_035844 [Heterodera trifolii]|uniref:Uncharacterized protein n=1 Tax=Heterodera trifolii TaxID=157864 RepID=A0ABD2IID2_9BILA
MATLLSFLANTMNIDVDRFGLAVTTSLSRWNEAQTLVEGMHERGYELKTRHLYPRERNVRLHGSELSRSGANRLGAYNGSARGPTVSELYRSRHGITLRHPSAPCLMEPGGNGHHDFFPIELIRVVAPDRISAPRGLSTRPLPRPRPSHFALWNRTDHPPRSRELVINVVPHDDSTARGAAEEYRIGVGRELTISGPLVLRIYAGALLLALFSFVFVEGQSLHAGPCSASSFALCSPRQHKISCLSSSLFGPSLFDFVQITNKFASLAYSPLPDGEHFAESYAESADSSISPLFFGRPHHLQIFKPLVAKFGRHSLPFDSSISVALFAMPSMHCSSTLAPVASHVQSDAASLFDPSSPRVCTADFVRAAESCPPTIGLCMTDRMPTISPTAGSQVATGVTSRWMSIQQREKYERRLLRENGFRPTLVICDPMSSAIRRERRRLKRLHMATVQEPRKIEAVSEGERTETAAGSVGKAVPTEEEKLEK